MRTMILAAVVLLGGCVTTRARVPLAAEYPAERRADIWNRAVGLLNERSYVLTLANADAGLITTDWRDDGTKHYGIAVLRRRHRVAINLEPGGRAVVNVIGETAADDGPWHAVADEKGCAELEAEQRAIYEAIVGHPPPEPTTAAATATPPSK